MAFATTNVTSGVRGNVKYLSGDWTASVGDTPGTIAIATGNLFSYDFSPGANSGIAQEKPLVTVSFASGISTITINHHNDVSNGTFVVEYS